MNEKRKLKRRQLLYYPEVYVRDTDYLLGKLADITQEGMMVVGDRNLQVDSELPVQIILPETLYNSTRVCLDVKCIRCKKEAKSGQYSTGLRIVNISDNDRLLVNRMILEYRIS